MTYRLAGPARRRTRAARRPRAAAARRAAVCALLLAATLTAADCGAPGGSGASGADKAAAPAGAPAGAPNGAVNGPDNGGTDPGGTPAVASGGDASRAAAPGSGPGATRKTPVPASYLVRTAALTVRTPHVETQLAAARRYAAEAGGYAGDENTSVDGRGHASSSVQLRVPAARYDTVLAELSGLGVLVDRTVKVQDVTGQVVDVDSRVKSQQASVSRVRGLMKDATSLTDVVSLESELSTRESALEALEAQRASLKSRTDLATITLRLSEPPARRAAPKPKKKGDGFWTTIGRALGDGWHAFYVALRGLSVVLAVALPFLALGALAALAYRRLRRRRGA